MFAYVFLIYLNLIVIHLGCFFISSILKMNHYEHVCQTVHYHEYFLKINFQR